MRKWMRDRLKRKKTTPSDPEKAQAPLQPAYFEAQAPAASDVVEPHHDPPVDQAQDAEPSPAATSAAQPDKAAPASRSADNQQPSRRRRRRGRGGRRSESGKPSPQTQAASAPASASADQQAAPAPALKPTKGAVILAIGLPGSGKSSWFKRHNITPLSSDMLRAILFDDAGEQRFQDLVFSNLRSMLKARLIARRPLSYVDATNLTPHERHGWIKLAKDFGYEPQAVFFDVPVEVCLDRNARRQRNVPEDVMRRKAEQLKPPTFEEGFAKITVVRVKQKD
jgi:predicted kinase